MIWRTTLGTHLSRKFTFVRDILAITALTTKMLLLPPELIEKIIFDQLSRSQPKCMQTELAMLVKNIKSHFVLP